MKQVLLLIGIFFIHATGLQAQTGLDTTFGNNGVINDPGSTNETEIAYSLAVQDDGKIVACGIRMNKVCIKRYNIDGSLDLSFGNQGEVAHLLEFGQMISVNDMTLQPDGKIVVGGLKSSNMFISRYNTNGSIDMTFGTNGVFVHPELTSGAQEVFIIDSGKIMVGSGNYILRLNSNGTPDVTFSPNGAVSLANYGFIKGIACYPDGKMLYLYNVYNGDNYETAFRRFTVTGMLDNTFGTDGVSIVHEGIADFVCQTVTLWPGGQIIAGGFGTLPNTNGTPAIVKLNPDGSRDPEFGTNGIAMTPVSSGFFWIEQVHVQLEDGKIVVGGSGVNGFTVLRYDHLGNLDPSFGNNGENTYALSLNQHNMLSMAVQDDGKAIVTGTLSNTANTNFLLLRFNGSNNTAGFESAELPQLKVYPNPVQDILTLDNPAGIFIDAIVVFDVTGKVVVTQHQSTQVDVSHLEQGVYILEVTSGGTTEKIKFIKQ